MSNLPAIQEQNAIVTMGFGSLQSFEFMQRTAKMFTHSSMVPTAYREKIEKGYGDNVTVTDNPSALPNCIIALNMSQRMNADPLMIMQNLHVIEGRPSWSSQFIIAAINSCGRYSPLRFDILQGEEIDATSTTFEWVDRKKTAKVTKTRVKNTSCIAWAVESTIQIPKFSLDDLKKYESIYGCCKAFGVPMLESPKVTMEMAVNEGWYGKNGSKWQSMPDLMLRYRSAAFFGRIYAPELLMGLPSAEETADIITVTQQPDGSYAPDPVTETPAMKQPQSKSEKAAREADIEKGAIVDAEVKPQEPAPARSPTGPVDAAIGEVKPPAAPARTEPDSKESPDAGTINPGQLKYLNNKIAALELPDTAIAAMLARVRALTLADLNAQQFDTLKSELLSLGA